MLAAASAPGVFTASFIVLISLYSIVLQCLLVIRDGKVPRAGDNSARVGRTVTTAYQRAALAKTRGTISS